MLHDSNSLPLPRLDDRSDTEKDPSDGDGEKEAKRQRSEPTTPVSTSSRQPYEYDAVMGITRVGTKEAERFEEGLDLEYHDLESVMLQMNYPKLNHSQQQSQFGLRGFSKKVVVANR